MSDKTTAFYRNNKKVSVDFSAEGVSSDGAVVLLEKIDRRRQLIQRFSQVIPDRRDPSKVDHSVEKMLRQRVFLLAQGYEDCNDAGQLKDDPVLTDTLGGNLASQPTLSRFENSIDKRAIFDLCYSWIERYVDSLAGRRKVIIDIDATDDPAHGGQQMVSLVASTGNICIMNSCFTMGRPARLLFPFCARATATPTGGTWGS